MKPAALQNKKLFLKAPDAFLSFKISHSFLLFSLVLRCVGRGVLFNWSDLSLPLICDFKKILDYFTSPIKQRLPIGNMRNCGAFHGNFLKIIIEICIRISCIASKCPKHIQNKIYTNHEQMRIWMKSIFSWKISQLFQDRENCNIYN